MDVREKIVELLQDANNPVWKWFPNNMAMLQLADYLIENGVTVQKSHCPYCCDDGVGHGMLKYSYEDEDGMAMSIHPSPKRENGYQSQAWLATVHFLGERRDFYIEVCPFCGRRLVPFKEEYETRNC